MATKFQSFGFGGFMITTGKGSNVLIDPYIDANEFCPVQTKDIDKVDLMLLSHPAFDHFGEAAELAQRFGCPVVCGSDSKALLLDRGVDAKQIVETVWGIKHKEGGQTIRSVESHHKSAATLQNGANISGVPLGFIIYLDDGTRVYNASDTALFSDLKLYGELYRPQVGLINVTMDNCFDFLPNYLSGEMSPYEAALAAQWLHLDCAIACHYVDKTGKDVQEFLELINKMRVDEESYITGVALNPGEVYVYGA